MNKLYYKFKNIQEIYEKALDYSLVVHEFMVGNIPIEEERKIRGELENIIHNVILNNKEYDRYIKLSGNQAIK